MMWFLIGGLVIIATATCISINWVRHMRFESRHNIEISRHDAEHQAIAFAHDNLDRQVDEKMGLLMETVNTEKPKRRKKVKKESNSSTQFLRAVVDSKVKNLKKSSGESKTY